MAKAIKPLMIVAAIAVNVIPGVGQVLSAAMITSITAAGIGAALGMAAGMLGMGPKAPKISSSQYDRLQANVDPTTPRKIVFGNTAMAVDIRHQEWAAVSGNAQGVLHRIFFHASHRVHSIDEVWLDDRMAWSAAGGVVPFYIDSTGSHQAVYFGVTTRTEGNAGNTIAVNGGAKWGSTRRATGLAYSHMFFRVIGANVKDKPMESPFSGGVPSRMTVRGKGAPVYDPRQDSTVPGGAGTHRANDQTTWSYTGTGGDIGRNPALQILWYLLGWRIGGKLALGRGIPASRIDMASFIAAANACDETVTSSINGTEPRYRSDGVFSENDDPNMVLDSLKAACNGEVRDFGGILSLHIRKNDLATVSVQLSEDDMLGGFIWKQTPDLDETFNEVRGRFVDPSNLALYQMRDYPAVRVEPPDGIERSDPFDLPTVQSISQAQRLAKGRLARNLYRGTFAADFNARAWATGVGKIVELSVDPLGWANKKFRVLEMGVRMDGVVPLLLQEEHADVYLWDNSDVPGVAPFAPTTYDPSLAPVRQIIDTITSGATRNVWRGPWAAGQLYLVGDLVMVGDTVYETIVEHTSAAGTQPPSANFTTWFATGAADGLSAVLTRPTIQLPASFDGIVAPADYANATGSWQIFAGSTDVTSQFLPIVTIDNDATLDVTYSAATYAVTGGFDNALDRAELVMKVEGTGSFVGITFERAFTLTKARNPISGDTTPPGPPTGLTLSSTITVDPAGVAQAQLVATWNANSETDLAYYELSVRASGGNFVDFIVGGATPRWQQRATIGVTYEAQIRAVDTTGNKSTTAPTPTTFASHLVGGDAVAPGLPTTVTATAAYQTIFLSWNNPSDADIAGVEVWENTSSSTTGRYKIGLANARPGTTGSFTRGSLPTNTQLWYWLRAIDASGNASGYTAVVTATTGYLPASHVTGQLTDAQVASLAASKVTGQLSDTQLAAISAAKVTGQITTTQITDDAITTPKIFAGAVTAAEIAALTITAAEIAANAITSAKIEAGAVIAAKIAAGQIQAQHIVSGAITTSKLTVAGADNTLPDEFTDLTWWTADLNHTVFEAVGPGYPAPRGLRFNVPNGSAGLPAGQLDRYSGWFPIDHNAQYRVEFGCYVSPDFNGWFRPVIHIPNVTWFNLRTGAHINDPAVTGTNADSYRAGEGMANTTRYFDNPASNGQNHQAQFRFTGNWTVGYVVFMCRITRVSDGTLIKDGAITTAKIVAGAITADKILAGTITGDKISTTTSLPGSITVGTTGVSIQTINERADNPISRANAATTTLLPGLVLVSGSTTLANWRQGGDETRIGGGMISANTITANKLTIGNRGLNYWGLEFEYRDNALYWTQGYIFWTDDAGNEQATLIPAGGQTFVANIYVYWVKGTAYLQATTNWSGIRADPNVVVLCTWFGGSNFVANYGGTIVHGDKITTGSITAAKMAVGYLEASWAQIGVLRTAASGARLEIDTTQVRVYDANRLRVRLGVW